MQVVRNWNGIGNFFVELFCAVLWSIAAGMRQMHAKFSKIKNCLIAGLAAIVFIFKKEPETEDCEKDYYKAVDTEAENDISNTRAVAYAFVFMVIIILSFCCAVGDLRYFHW